MTGDGRWSEEDASILVPRDIISIKLGDIVPVDAWLLEGDPLRIDQSTLIGESLLVTKHPSDEVFSGSTYKQGEIEVVGIATRIHTFLGKAVHLVDSTNQVGHFQQVLTTIGKFCICSIAISMLLEIVAMYLIQNHKYRDGIVLLTGDIPIARPTVLLVTMAIGAHQLSQQDAITKRITAIEEMAGMDVLCGDKTRTLILYKLSIDKNLVEVFAKGVNKEGEDSERSSQCGLWLLIFTCQVWIFDPGGDIVIIPTRILNSSRVLLKQKRIDAGDIVFWIFSVYRKSSLPLSSPSSFFFAYSDPRFYIKLPS